MEELKNIPTQTHHHSKIAWILVGSSLFILFVWGFFSQLNSGAVAMGEIIPSDKTLTIQHLEGGIIRQIYVKDGQMVKKGDKLLDLDQLVGGSELEINQNEKIALESLIKRLEAERDGKNISHATSQQTPSQLTQIELFKTRKEGLSKDIAILKQRIEQMKQEIIAHKFEEKALSTMLSTAKEAQSMNQELYNSRYIDKRKLLDSQNNLADIEGKIGRKLADISQVNQKITETNLQIVRMQTQWKNDLLEELRKAQDNYIIACEKVKISSDKLKRSTIVSPDDGKIHGLKFNTIGGTIQAGIPILNLVPTNEKLIVEAKISPDDIDVVHVGLSAYVRITAFKQRTHNAVKGVVIAVSPDTYKEEQQGISYYKAKISIDPKELAGIQKMDLHPGMLAQVEIVTGERSAMHYLVQPVLDSFHRAFKEE